MPRYRNWLICCVVLFLMLAGCSESVTPAPVVIDGHTTLAEGGYLTGKNGFTVDARQVVTALGGSIEQTSPTAIVVTLNGRRFLVSYGTENETANYDQYIKSSPSAIDGVLQLTGVAMDQIMSAAFPKGRAYRQNRTIYVNSGR